MYPFWLALQRHGTPILIAVDRRPREDVQEMVSKQICPAPHSKKQNWLIDVVVQA
jgi:hypothetical protein